VPRGASVLPLRPGMRPRRRPARPAANPGNLGTLTGGPARMISRVPVMAGGDGHRAGRVSGLVM